MPTVDFTSGYRDATKGATLKALQLRQKEAAEQQMQAMAPRTIAAPEQGWAQIAGVVGAGLREGRAASQEQAGREQFAQLLAGGLTPDEMGQAMMLDPDIAMKYQENTWATEREKAEQDATNARELMKHGWDVDAATERVRTDREAQDRLFGHQDQTAVTAAQTAEEKAQADLKREQEKTGVEVITGEEAAALGLDPAGRYERNKFSGDITPIAAVDKPKTKRQLTGQEIQALIDKGVKIDPNKAYEQDETGDINPLDTTSSGFSAAQQEERTFKTKSTLGSIDNALTSARRALELAPDVTELGEYGRKYYGPAGWAPESMTEKMPFDYKKIADATQRFDQIMQSNAFKELSVTLAGTDSDRDVKNFLGIFANPNSSLELKKQTLNNMINRLTQERGIQAERLKGITGEETGEYVYTNPDALEGDATAPAPTDPIAKAKAAIAAGAPRDKVIKRLQDAGIDATGL